MTTLELEWLASQAQTHRLIAEVGSWQGRSTRALADNTEGTVFCFDHWKGADNDVTAADQWLKRFVEGYGGPAGLWQKFYDNTADLIGSRVIPFRVSSADGAALFPAKIFDMVFIDAAHDAESVKADISAWSRLLNDGGLLCGHDYCTEWKDDVMVAVDELVPQRQIVPNTSIWFDYVYWRNTESGTA